VAVRVVLSSLTVIPSLAVTLITLEPLLSYEIVKLCALPVKVAEVDAKEGFVTCVADAAKAASRFK
jgi:hypothetical protein